MTTKQDSQQEMIYSVKQIRRKHRTRRLLLRACLCFLLAGAVCFSTVKIAAGFLFPSGNGNAARETLSASGERQVSSAEGKSDETSKVISYLIRGMAAKIARAAYMAVFRNGTSLWSYRFCSGMNWFNRATP